MLRGRSDQTPLPCADPKEYGFGPRSVTLIAGRCIIDYDKTIRLWASLRASSVLGTASCHCDSFPSNPEPTSIHSFHRTMICIGWCTTSKRLCSSPRLPLVFRSGSHIISMFMGRIFLKRGRECSRFETLSLTNFSDAQIYR